MGETDDIEHTIKRLVAEGIKVAKTKNKEKVSDCMDKYYTEDFSLSLPHGKTTDLDGFKWMMTAPNIEFESDELTSIEEISPVGNGYRAVYTTNSSFKYQGQSTHEITKWTVSFANVNGSWMILQAKSAWPDGASVTETDGPQTPRGTTRRKSFLSRFRRQQSVGRSEAADGAIEEESTTKASPRAANGSAGSAALKSLIMQVVNEGAKLTKAKNPTALSRFINDYYDAKFTLMLPSGDSIDLEAFKAMLASTDVELISDKLTSISKIHEIKGGQAAVITYHTTSHFKYGGVAQMEKTKWTATAEKRIGTPAGWKIVKSVSETDGFEEVGKHKGPVDPEVAAATKVQAMQRGKKARAEAAEMNALSMVLDPEVLLEDSDADGHVFYVNVVMKSAKEMLGKKVGKGFVGRAAVRAGEHVLTPARLAAKLGPELTKQIPNDLAEEGVSSESELMLVEGALVVIRVRIEEVDVDSVLSKVAAESARAGKIANCIIHCLPAEALKKLQHEVLSKAFAGKLVDMLGPEMQRQTKQHGVAIEAFGKTPAQQGPFLLDLLRQAEQ